MTINREVSFLRDTPLIKPYYLFSSRPKPYAPPIPPPNRRRFSSSSSSSSSPSPFSLSLSSDSVSAMGKASKRVKRATQSDSEAEFDSEDALKGQAVKNQKVLWNKSLEIRFLLQKAFSNSNKLPKDPIRSEFCNSDKAVKFLFSKGLI